MAVPFGQAWQDLLSKLKYGVGSVQLTQPVPLKNGVASGQGTEVLEGRFDAGL